MDKSTKKQIFIEITPTPDNSPSEYNTRDESIFINVESISPKPNIRYSPIGEQKLDQNNITDEKNI